MSHCVGWVRGRRQRYQIEKLTLKSSWAHDRPTSKHLKICRRSSQSLPVANCLFSFNLLLRITRINPNWYGLRQPAWKREKHNLRSVACIYVPKRSTRWRFDAKCEHSGMIIKKQQRPKDFTLSRVHCILSHFHRRLLIIWANSESSLTEKVFRFICLLVESAGLTLDGRRKISMWYI